ncbi:MAG: type II toxin-antitoxin system ParD family antitoxin [Candidatus Dormibacteria bacterium]
MPSSYVVGDHFGEFIKHQIASGRYASASEVIRDALRLLEEQEKVRALHLAELRDLIRVGRESGPGVDAKTVFAGLRRRIDEADEGEATAASS